MADTTFEGDVDFIEGLEASDIDALGVFIINHFSAGAQTAAAKKHQAILPVAATLVGYRARLDTAPTGATAILDFNLDGVTMFTTQANRPIIAISANNSSTTLPDVVAATAGQRFSIDVDQIGSSVAGSDLTVTTVWKAALVD
jgi:hypothetical protein